MRRIVIDIETNSKLVEKVKNIWCIVCKDIDTGEIEVFRNEDIERRFRGYWKDVSYVIGHNWLDYDLRVLNNLLQLTFPIEINSCVDTLIVSRLVDFSRPGGHSIEQYGKEFGLEKIDHKDFTKWSKELEDYCVRDVEICHRIFNHYVPIITSASWSSSLDLEHKFQMVVNSLHNTGFAFDTQRARSLLSFVVERLGVLDKEIKDAFPPKMVVARTFTPTLTKFGTINKTSVPKGERHRICDLKAGETYEVLREQVFNPSSHKQLIDVLTTAGWKPEVKTKTHLDCLREINRLKYTKNTQKEVDLAVLSAKLLKLEKYGWRVNEENLSTLPSTSPAPARTLARRILLESRRRTLVEWLGLISEDGRIHGKFIGIGAWTHRMAHQEPNTANIPTELKENGEKKLLGKELRSLWIAPKNRLLLGTDAEGIQFRVFAHYVNSKELINAIVNGSKSNKTDPHSYNQRVLGSVCRSRQAAKRYIFALLLGARIDKLSEILECSRERAEEALDSILRQYPGFKTLKQSTIPTDARRGYFIGLDGRIVPIPGSSVGERRHLCMSGYLQNGEAVIMKRATLKWINKLSEYDCKLVNFIHDEWQTEGPDIDTLIHIGKLQADSLREVGEELKLNCPMAGSFGEEGHYTIGSDWSVTH